MSTERCRQCQSVESRRETFAGATAQVFENRGQNGNQAMHFNVSDLYLLVALACVITFLRGPL
jgi:hypothetical protein